jgi:hypothetical protein
MDGFATQTLWITIVLGLEHVPQMETLVNVLTPYIDLRVIGVQLTLTLLQHLLLLLHQVVVALQRIGDIATIMDTAVIMA